jgi:hypothetical protein
MHKERLRIITSTDRAIVRMGKLGSLLVWGLRKTQPHEATVTEESGHHKSRVKCVDVFDKGDT